MQTTDVLNSSGKYKNGKHVLTGHFETLSSIKKKKGVVKGGTIIKGQKPNVSFSTNSFYKVHGTPYE